MSAARVLAAPAAPPIVLTGPSILIGDLHYNGAGGGWFSGQAPLGGTFVVGANGDVIVGDGYGHGVFEITPGGTQSVLAAFDNSNAAGIDQYGNVYLARDYGDSFVKIPYDAVRGAYAGFTTLPTTNCLGGTQDKAACIFAPGTKSVIDAGATAGGGSAGFTSLFFDGQGNFFFATDTNPGAKGNLNTIYECSAQCQAETDGAGTYPPLVIYADAQATLGVAAVDPRGNVFFSDGQGNSSGNKTYLEELPYSGGKYASAPTAITTYTSGSGYNGISGVVAASANAIYFAVPNDGVYAIPNSSSGPDGSGLYKVSNEGGKGLTMDAAGNLYVVQYSGTLSNDGVFITQMENAGFASSPVGTAAATVNATVIDNAGNCTTPPSLAFAASEGGLATAEFTATPGTACSAAANTSAGTFSPAMSSSGASFSAALAFTPARVGERNAALTIGDSADAAMGVAALTGIGQGALANLDPGVSTAYTSGLTAPASVVADAAGDVFIADSSAGKVFEIASGSTTPVAVGSGFMSPRGLAFDASGNLFIADDGVPEIEEILNTGTTGAFTAGAQSTVIGSTFPFGGTALKDATGLAIGPNGTLYIADTGNSRVVSYNPGTGQAAVTNATATGGLASPVGVAVDGAGNLYVADSGSNKIDVFPAAGGVTAVTPTGIAQVSGVAVDASGSIIVSDATSGAIVRIPNLSGTLTTSQAVNIETVSTQASSVWLDPMGNLYVADSSGKSAFAFQRTAAAIDLGTVQNGLTNSGTVYLENAGNQSATLATPSVTQPANTMFTLASGATNGCTDGSTAPAGSSCELAATFAPIVGTANGVQSGTAAVNLSTPAESLAVNLSGTATQSSVLAQTITNFNPPAAMQVGQQAALSATGGASGKPLVFSIDAASSCPKCASVDGNVLTAIAAGSVIVDANQAGGQANGNQYAAAQQVQATIVIGNSLVPTGVPALQMNQTTFIYPILSAGFTDGQNPQGGSFAITQDGEIVVGNTYGNTVYFINAQTGAVIQSVSFNGPGGIAIDSKNNLYISHLYNSIVYKVPFENAGYALADNPTPAPPACTGSGSVECVFANSGQNTKAIGFDPSGNFYEVTEPSTSGSGASAIYECNTSCQPTGTGTLLYSDTNGISQIAFDPWGNLYFTDSNYLVNGSSDESNSGESSSNLMELPYTAGTGFASTPTVLQTFTNTSPGNYDDMLASVTVNQTNGTIYYGILYDGTFAIPNSQAGGPVTSDQYAVSSQGAKGLITDANGNLYIVANTNGKDTAGVILLGDLTTPGGQYNGAPVTASATMVDSAFGCGTAATLAISSSNPEFSATAGTTCSSIGVGDGTLSAALPATSSYPATITFTASNVGAQTATLGLSDTANGGTGTAKVTGVGLETPQSITFTAPTTTTYTYSPTLTVTFGATGGGSNNPVAFSVDPSSTGAGAFSGTTLTVSQAGTIVVDANEAGGLVNGVFYEDATQAQLTITINQATQSIVFAPPVSPVTYAPGLTVTLTAAGGDSGNPVTFSVDGGSSGAGSVSGNVLTVTQAGTIVIDANQATNADYLAAPQVQQTLVVNKATQTITFIPLGQPFHYIAGGATLAIQATGGGSNDAITFSVDPSSTMTGSFSASTVSGSTSTSVLTLPAQTAASGTIVIDAMQPGNANYSDSASTSETVTILSPLPTQSISFSNPGTQVVGAPLTLTGTSTSGFPVQYVASPSTVCTVSGSTAAFIAAGTCTIVASQPGDNLYFAAAVPVTQTFMVNPTGQVPAMNVNLSLSSMTIQQGTVGLTQLNVVSSNNFTGSVSFACSGQPSGYTCAFNPSTVTVGPNATAATTLTVTAGSSTAALHRDLRSLFPITFALAFCFFGFRKRNRLQLLMLAVVALFGLSLFTACGGTSSTATTTQAKSSTITVTATSGAMKSSATLSLTVQ